LFSRAKLSYGKVRWSTHLAGLSFAVLEPCSAARIDPRPLRPVNRDLAEELDGRH
jgi:hypothetical protein